MHCAIAGLRQSVSLSSGLATSLPGVSRQVLVSELSPEPASEPECLAKTSILFSMKPYKTRTWQATLLRNANDGSGYHTLHLIN